MSDYPPISDEHYRAESARRQELERKKSIIQKLRAPVSPSGPRDYSFTLEEAYLLLDLVQKSM